MVYSPKSRTDARYLVNKDVAEVLDIFDSLFEAMHIEWLPQRVVVTDVYRDAEIYNLRDNVTQWEEDRRPREQRLTYDEIQGIERAALYASISASDMNLLCAPFEEPAVHDELVARLPLPLQSFALWIIGDFKIFMWRRENGRGTAMLSDWPIERPADWATFVNEAQTAEELNALRRSVNRGCPFGEDDWRDQMVCELGLESTMRERGRPSRRKMVESARRPV